MALYKVFKREGILGVILKVWRVLALRSGGYAFYYRDTPRYRNPNAVELNKIEADLRRLGETLVDYRPAPEAFAKFRQHLPFPANYHGGEQGEVWDEKLLEHFIAADLLGLEQFSPQQTYVDIAACASPWVNLLHERLSLDAVAIDLDVDDQYRDLPYYRCENATATRFAASSVAGASLQCAYEMFRDEDDRGLIDELSRILQPGAKVIILPLYMHTHYCTYATPEYWGKGYSDPQAVEYLRLDCLGVPSSRKYDPVMLQQRVLQPIREAGMTYRLLVLRNQEALGQGIYCHFILEITR